MTQKEIARDGHIMAPNKDKKKEMWSIALADYISLLAQWNNIN